MPASGDLFTTYLREYPVLVSYQVAAKMLGVGVPKVEALVLTGQLETHSTLRKIRAAAWGDSWHRAPIAGHGSLGCREATGPCCETGLRRQCSGGKTQARAG